MKLSKNSFAERERTLEDEFFFRADQALLKKLKEQVESDKGREKLAAVTGLSDTQLLDDLLDSGIGPDCLVAFSLVPLVQIAWVDRIVETEERAAILRAAHEVGVEDSSESYQLLESWLHHKPEEKLYANWRRFVHEIIGSLSDSQKEQLRDDVVARTREVAEAAGGYLGAGTVSEAEEQTIAEIAATFDGTSHA